MMRKVVLIVFSVSLLALGPVGVFAADAKKADAEKPKAEAKPKVEAKKSGSGAKQQLVTEAEFAQWLVQVLGLARFLPATPSDQECFSILLQNGIRPANGWNSTNVVTRGTLARVTVQAMDQVGQVKDASKDESYIEYLRSMGIEIGTIGEAVEHLDPLGNPEANVAISVSTDPLSKTLKIRPVDELMLGTDMATITRIFSAAEIPDLPPPMTPQ
jgi:hypothetical protein